MTAAQSYIRCRSGQGQLPPPKPEDDRTEWEIGNPQAWRSNRVAGQLLRVFAEGDRGDFDALGKRQVGVKRRDRIIAAF